mmetsp:Transcript_15713/g.19952  ORF Transcript_15713/g.19952 Transcript_15713/m.19952 type:complete len:430 (+) Transcript_15713:76-1365(+)|eukprot:CAMPEP_0203666062 /NCGR_PEP_ID=MMETSP0090-20130426/3179_1 /ASSEMBLY_ACC=CAM_ASM_001088 /TAXON_ID=426623 /ORGANISM="Chaetoceros affinis, Strain CCMP159" /LENGTH=429 /DNA_ID=CAMNT_0050529843 /DNA_START=75 /DNA_END=1364 /DNA_ORIENTATION=-
MTTVSLSATIFGKDKVDGDGGLSSLFSTSSSTLPAKPNKVNFTETTSARTKRERKEEKKKKRKRKNTTTDDDNQEYDGDNKDKISLTDAKDTPPTDKKRKSNEIKGENEEGQNTTVESVEKIPSDEEDLTLFVGNLPLDISRKSFESMFKECGKIKSSRLRSYATDGVKVAPEHAGNQSLVKKVAVNTKKLLKNSPKNTAQGYIVFENMESVEKALSMNNTTVSSSNGDLILRVDRAKPTLDSTRSVFIGNLPYKANEMTLRKHFKDGCDWDDDDDDVIEGVRIVRDKNTMQCKGFGYLLLKDKSFVPQALTMHESTYMKRDIRVMVCGKRFKGRKGAHKDGTVELKGAMRRVLNSNKDKMDTKNSSNIKDLIGSSKDEKKKKRGEKKVGVKKSGARGISKRAASGKKLHKRMKKIQKRLQKGMGKAKK